MGVEPQLPPSENNSQEEVPCGGNFVPQNGPQQQEENPYDKNFDAGVEANEEEDPEKFIQQLTGKLSQSLKKFNDENGTDAGLNKYVAGMIIKQAMKGLNDKDAKEIMDKVKADEDFTPKEEENTEQETKNSEEQNESINRDRSEQIKEIVNNVLQNKKETFQEPQTLKTTSYKKKPFTSPNFE